MSSVSRWVSPLRYPGGKVRMTPFLVDLFWSQWTDMDVEVWLEPFAGGAGAALKALEDDQVPEAWVVERNPALAAFWRVVSEDGERLAQRVEMTVPTLRDFDRAREVVTEVMGTDRPVTEDVEDVAFSAFVLNRCSRSGIVSGSVGPIGGKRQEGRHKVADRWNGPALAQRLRRVHALGSRLKVHEGDGISYVEDLPGSGIGDEVFVFLDPPYVEQGNALYAKGFDSGQHERLAAALHRLSSPWIMTYDAHPEVLRLYPDHQVMEYEIAHTANRQGIGTEYAVLGAGLHMPEPGNPIGKRGWRWVA